MRFVDMAISFPRLVLLITIVALFDSNSIFMIMAVLGFTQWPGTTRIVRGEVLSLREREFIEAARALGFSRSRIILRHVIPNVLAPVIVASTLGIGNVIVLEAGLSFLGMGLQPPTPSWGGGGPWWRTAGTISSPRGGYRRFQVSPSCSPWSRSIWSAMG
jgi:peptide/nickel transport system permease protein